MNAHPDAGAPEDLPSEPAATYMPSARRLRDEAAPTLEYPHPRPWTVSIARHASPDSSEGRTLPPPDRAGAAQDEAPAQEPAFELLHLIGRGGMGEVWQGRQASLHRLVAIKTIRRDGGRVDPDDDNSITRRLREFHQEAVTAAALDHPNIVPVYDLGTGGDDGMPMLAMKLVEGQSWLRALIIDSEELDPSAFLAKHLPILKDVAQAVAFAHSRGIVHRDLKPEQVMTGAFGETLLMDWGLALHMGEAPAARDAELARMLPSPGNASSPAGTPAMMAPEQTRVTAEGIGTWTDVYLLGGILYYLLTGGTYPHAARTSEIAFQKAMDGIVEPPHVRAPHRPIPQDLETLCLHAMAPVPADRVPSAQEFIARLNDYLTGAGRRRESEAITSRAAADAEALERDKQGRGLPPFDAYVRHDEVGDTVGRALELWPDNAAARELRARNLAARLDTEIDHGDLLLAKVHLAQLRAIASGDEERIDAIQRRLLSAERRREDHRRQRFALAWAAAALFLCAIAFAFISRNNAARATRNMQIAKQQGDGSLRLVSYILQELRAQMETQLTTARGLTLEDANAIKHEIAGSVGAKVLDYFAGLDEGTWPAPLQVEFAAQLEDACRSFLNLEQNAAAETLARRTLGIREKVLGPGDPRSMRAMQDLGNALLRRGDTDAAEKLLRRALALREQHLGKDHIDVAETLNTLAILAEMRGDEGAALALHERALAIRAAQRPGSRIHAESLGNVSLMLQHLGDYEAAEKLLLQSIAIKEKAIGPDDPDTVTAYGNLAALMAARGKLEDAEALMRRVLADRERLCGPNHNDTATTLHNLADTLIKLKRPAEAVPLSERAVAIWEKVHGADSIAVSAGLNTLASAVGDAGDPDRELEILQRCLDIRRPQLGPDHPETVLSENNLAVAYRGQQRYAEALPLYQHAHDVWLRTYGPEHPLVATACLNLGDAWTKLGDIPKGDELKRRAYDIRAKMLGTGHPDTLSALESLGVHYLLTSRPDDAAREFTALLAIHEQAHGIAGETTTKRRRSFANALRTRGAETHAVRLYEDAISRATDPADIASIKQALDEFLAAKNPATPP